MSSVLGDSPRAYRGHLRNWDERATIRVQPRRVLSAEEATGKVYFVPELVPVLRHPHVVALGPSVVRRLLIEHLYQYLDFTAHLEHDVVNSVASCIALGKTGFDLPRDTMHDAYKLYCDEAYHALFSADLRRQVEDITNIPSARPRVPHAMQWLRATQLASPRDSRSLIKLFFVIVSETLISATLTQIPKDERVVTAVRKMVADHAEDERRHHAYFAALLDVLWPSMTPRQQAAIGPLLPDFILAFLEPDYAAIRDQLARCGVGADRIEEVIEESYPAQHVRAAARGMAKATIRLCERAGMLEHSHTVERFRETGLIV
jgi:P-aminobenzoate N-oxygenase AurF